MAPKRESFTITWRIEHYNFFSKDCRKCIESPSFVIDTVEDTSWKLQIWPISLLGVERESMAFYVIRSVNGPLFNCGFQFEINVFTDDGPSPLFQDSNSFTFDETGDQASYFVPHHKIYTRKIPPNILTIRCRMLKPGKSFLEIGQCSIRTRIRVERTAFMGLMENFSNLLPSEKRSLTIKSSSADKELFVLNLNLAGDLCCKEKVWIEVIYIPSIVPINKDNTKFCVCKVFLLDSEGVKTECGRSETLFSDKQWKFPLKFTKGYLMGRNTHFLSNDTLTFKFEFALSSGIEYERIEDSEFGKNTIVNKNQSKFNSALEDMTSLFKEGILCDIKLKTETETFNVHKNILSARSPVFKTMFTTEMREKINDCVTIEDVEADTVRRMLLFLYSDKLEDLDWERAKSLYFAAVNYNIAALKQRCSEFLMSNLQPSDSCDLLLLSDRHQDENLKKAVHEYIAEHHEEILQTDQWMNLAKSNPVLTTETFQALYLRNWKN